MKIPLLFSLACSSQAFVPSVRTRRKSFLSLTPAAAGPNGDWAVQQPRSATAGANGDWAPMATLPKDTTVAQVPRVAQRWRKSTKQVITLGPASSSKEMIEKLFLAGADVFRLNFSHGSQEQKKELLMLIREVEEKYSHPIAILGDLQGPKLRVRIK